MARLLGRCHDHRNVRALCLNPFGKVQAVHFARHSNVGEDQINENTTAQQFKSFIRTAALNYLITSGSQRFGDVDSN